MTAAPRYQKHHLSNVPHAQRNSDALDNTTSTASAMSRSEVLYLNAIDAVEFRAWFAPKFAEWLKAQFPSPEVVAAVFQVRNSTAWNWWNGDNRASGDAVARTFLMFPQAVAWFMAEWDAR